MAIETDIDDQDQAETFDEEATGGDSDLEGSYPFDRDRSVRDETSALGDADLDGDEDALDADEEDDETLDDLDGDADEDDLDDEGSDGGLLAVDDIPDFSSDGDFADAPDSDAEDGVGLLAEDEADITSLGDMTQAPAGATVADYESDTLSDADLAELDYMDADPKTPADPEADAPKLKPDEAEARDDDERLDEGLEETFPASDPVSAKHIT